MNKWQTVFRNETGWDYTTQHEEQIRMVYVDDTDVGEIVCRIFGHPDAKVQEDRARLITLAPELLSLLKDMQHEDQEDTTEKGVVLDLYFERKVAALIASAEKQA